MILPLLLATFAGGPPPHFGPPLDFRFLIEPEAVLCQVRGELRVWNRWLGLGLDETQYDEFDPSDALPALFSMATDCFHENGQVWINDVEILPEACEVKPYLAAGFNGMGIPGLEVQFLLHYEGPSVDKLRFDWHLFAEIDGQGEFFEEIPVAFREHKLFNYGFLHTWEPSYTWRAGMEHDRIEFVPPPKAPAPTPRQIPVASLAILATGVLGLVYLRRLQAPGLVLSAFLVCAAGSAWWTRDRAIYAWVPASERLPDVPDELEALKLFERLHQNVYAAFASETESEIYDLLAQSVTPDLLDSMYAEIYTSLVLQDEGGARCEIEQIETTEKAISSMDPENATFSVDYAWFVYGSVYHYNHGHKRLNQYRARYYVSHDGDSWKISAVDPRMHARIDDGKVPELLYDERPADGDEEDES